jgi:predicted metallopeptidase
MSLARQQTPRPAGAPRAGGHTRPAGFDFTFHMRRLCDDMVVRIDRLRHIDMSRVAISFSQARKATSHGMHASLTPMRFAGGKMHTIRRKQRWGVQRLHGADGREMLYILNFYLPRFLDLKFREKLSTVMHELWHIGPKFDGDVRRYGGRCFAHGSSQEQYDALIEELVDRWLASGPPESVCEFLHYNFHQFQARYGRVYGRKIPTPKLIRVG